MRENVSKLVLNYFKREFVAVRNLVDVEQKIQNKHRYFSNILVVFPEPLFVRQK
jgi:hypothetical protein